MNTEIILKVDKLENLVAWIARNFVCGDIPSNVRALYLFANKPDTSVENDAANEYGKFDDEYKAEEYFDAFSQTKFIIESELADTQEWTHNRETQNEYKKVTETWKITATPSMNNTEDAFVAYCPKPYNPV